MRTHARGDLGEEGIHELFHAAGHVLLREQLERATADLWATDGDEIG